MSGQHKYLVSTHHSVRNWCTKFFHILIFILTPRTVISPLIEVYGGKAAYSNFWGGMDEEASVRIFYLTYQL